MDDKFVSESIERLGEICRLLEGGKAREAELLAKLLRDDWEDEQKAVEIGRGVAPIVCPV